MTASARWPGSATASVTTSATATACLQNWPSCPTGQEQSYAGSSSSSSHSRTWYDDEPRTFAFALDAVTVRLPTRPFAA